MDKHSKNKSDIFMYFTQSSDNKHYVCACEILDDSGNISMCGTKIAKPQTKNSDVSSRAYNLKRHLSRLHPEILRIMEEKKKEHELPKPGTSTGRSSQPDITKFSTCQKVTLSINANIFKNSIIELIVKDSMPLSMFGKPAMRNLLE